MNDFNDMTDFKLADFFDFFIKNKDEPIQDKKVIKFAVLRSYTCELLEPILFVHYWVLGYKAEFYFCDFNQYAQDVLDPGSSFNKFKPDMVLFLVMFEDLFVDFYMNYSISDVERWRGAIHDGLDDFLVLVKQVVTNHKCPVVLQNFGMNDTPYYGFYDDQQLISQQDLIAHANQHIKESLSGCNLILYWNYNRFISMNGSKNIFNERSYYFAHDPFKSEVYVQIAGEIIQLVVAYLGKRKKCIVLDLDNTLWGGVIGEDGLSGIALGGTYPGNCFVRVQQKLLALKKSGLLLAINSKNNFYDAISVFRDHPDMVLKEMDIVTMRVNWNDKATNLKSIALELNIGLDSMIFIDDNPAEVDMVRQVLPEVTSVLFDDSPFLLPSKIDKLERVGCLLKTDEDKYKTEMYKNQFKRKKEEEASYDLSSFLKNLGMNVRIEDLKEHNINRMAQLTQKTNQFNFSTKRYTASDIAKLAKIEAIRLFTVKAEDKYGNHGIVGALILKFVGSECVIDTFLLSCRVLSRGVEFEMLNFIKDYAISKACEYIIFNFVSTEKNKPACEFLSECGVNLTDNLPQKVAIESFFIDEKKRYANTELVIGV